MSVLNGLAIFCLITVPMAVIEFLLYRYIDKEVSMPNVDRSEIALIGAVLQAALALAVDFGVKLTTQQQTDILVFEGAIAALVAAYLIHRGQKAA